MRIRKPIAAFATALALWASNSDESLGQPLPPGPPLPRGGGGPPRPVMGPMGGSPPQQCFSAPGGIGGPTRPQILGPGGSGPTRPQVLGPGGVGPTRPQNLGAGGVSGRDHVSGLGALGSLVRSSPTAGKPSTFAVNRQALSEQANRIRNSYHHHDYFRSDWCGRHPGAWGAHRWAAAAAAYYGTAYWTICYGYCGYYAVPYYYDYGSTVIYESTNVYVNGEAVATQQQFAQEATAIADTGKQAQVSEDEEWLLLGVFAMVQGEQANGNDVFQLAVNKSGVLRGNYYNTLTDTTLPVCGSVDARTQRAAWTVGDRKEPVFEAGFANLTQSETTMLVHFGQERTQQWALIRIEQSPEPKYAGAER